jgi:hypothetical protein
MSSHSKNLKKKQKNSYSAFEMLLNISYSLYSFQIVPHIFRIYYKHFYVKALKTCNIGIVLTLKDEKAK